MQKMRPTPGSVVMVAAVSALMTFVGCNLPEPEPSGSDAGWIVVFQDNCPDDEHVDAGGNVHESCENDVDSDGILNDDDNCPTVANSDQLDTNSNGIGDACDSSGVCGIASDCD